MKQKIEIFVESLLKNGLPLLPGLEAQLLMAPTLRKYALQYDESQVKMAGVVVLLFKKYGDWYLVLIERTNHHANDHHGGQIGFPGGKLELHDKDIKEAAVRELSEELGVSLREGELIGGLTDIYIPVSNFLVFPFLAIIETDPSYEVQIEEVAGVLEVKLEDLFNLDAVKKMDMPMGDIITLKGVPYFDVNGRIVWGATAMILSEFVELYRRADVVI